MKREEKLFKGTIGNKTTLKQRLDALKKEKDKNIGLQSVLITALFVELFWMLKDLIYDRLKALPLKSDALVIILFFLIGFISTTVIYYVVYLTVRGLHSAIWNKKNARMCVNGYWLHLHIKDTTRIGYVQIEQRFDRIAAKGWNTAPDGNAPQTDWKYEVGKVEKSGNDSSLEIKYKYYASYYAERGKEKVKKHGIHQMDILQRDDRYAEYPVEMAGYFGDTARDAADGDIQQHFGSLFFFRIRESLGNKLKKMDCPEKRLEFIREQVKICLDGKETPYPEIARLCETIRLVRTDSEEAVKQ